jgi:CRISPR-associated endonuclease/helicase Cas3
MIARIDAALPQMVRDHEAAAGTSAHRPATAAHGLAMRLALSCLVDADHEDSAAHDRGGPPPDRLEPRWEERLAALDRCVAGLPADGDPDRQRRRMEFYDECRNALLDAPLTACEGPVGIGKTTAILAHLLRRASEAETPPRHILVVAPFTNIVSQTVGRLRAALTAPGERPEDVVAEHHHRADFASPEARELAMLWKAPVVVTTAVQLFETLGGNSPPGLRKLHELPGSWVFLDEAHAALPARMWPQAWAWLRELTDRWGCRFVLASGSLIRFWKLEKIDRTRPELPLLAPVSAGEATGAETTRVRYERIADPLNLDGLCDRIADANGPRLVILNTVQSAAAVARHLRAAGGEVLHLSTALCPADRERILNCVGDRLAAERQGSPRDWTLVATSCVEAGVDLSVQAAFRESCSVASLIQVGGRVNRHGERNTGTVYSFTTVPGGLLTCHPEFETSSRILNDFFKQGRLDSPDPAAVVTDAMQLELKKKPSLEQLQELLRAERERDYPKVADLSRVIRTDTRVVAVDDRLKQRLSNRRDRVSSRELLLGSVQIWSDKVRKLALEPLPHMPDVFLWGGRYDRHFLGYMDEVLENAALQTEGFIIV